MQHAPHPTDAQRVSFLELDQQLRRLRFGTEMTLAERMAELEVAENELDSLFQKEYGGPKEFQQQLWSKASHWQSLVQEKGLALSEQRTSTLVEDLHYRDWKEVAERAQSAQTPHDCFLVLDDILRLRLEAQEVPSDFSDLKDLAREKFLQLIAENPPGRQRQEHWVEALIDRADSTLTGLDDMEPLRAAKYLHLVARALEWHRRKVDTGSKSLEIRLQRKVRRLRAEEQERNLQMRLERQFGRPAVGRWERLVLWLIFLVLGILFLELFLDLSATQRFWLTVVDSLACGVFLWDFFFKLSRVRGSKSNWFWRHFFVDFLPSIPFGLVLLSSGSADPVRAGRAARLLRLPRFARYVRLLLPVIRIARAFGFLAKGLDRVVGRYGHLINNSIILYPNRYERSSIGQQAGWERRQIWRLQSEVNHVWHQLMDDVESDQAEEVAMRRVQILEAAEKSLGDIPEVEARSTTILNEWTADQFVERLGSVTPEQVEAEFGASQVGQLARIVRLFHVPPLRWTPPIAGFIPRLTSTMAPNEVLAAVAQQTARRLRRFYDRLYWFFDWYGTITPSEVVDRVGSALVKGSFRPAYRLTLFGGFYLLTHLLLEISGSSMMKNVADFLDKYVGTTLVVIGGICFFILALGWWMKRIAKEATSFLEQTAEAQYLPFTETIKSRHLERDGSILEERVLGPEALLDNQETDERRAKRQNLFRLGVRAWLLGARERHEIYEYSEALERVILLYRDSLKGSLLCESDTRTTDQLLGNLSICHLREISSRITRGEDKRLRSLDLTNPQAGVRGPYLWFNQISKAIAQTAARLIVDYNRHAIPLRDLDYADSETKKNYQAWLKRETSSISDSQDEKSAKSARRHYLTTAFTALHFLDDDEVRDNEIGSEFGDDVLAKMRADRELLFRTIFGSFPVHARPRDRRILNPYDLYQRYLAGGRALFLPVFAFLYFIRVMARMIVLVFRAIQEIRRPRREGKSGAAAQADFTTAMRKIDRMRGPVVKSCIWLRARFDPEYLGVQIPRTPNPNWSGRDVYYDLSFVKSSSDFYRSIENERASANQDMARLEKLFKNGLLEQISAHLDRPLESLDAEQRRAAAIAYRADFESVRTLLSCREILQETFAEVWELRPHLHSNWWKWNLRRKFNRYWESLDEMDPDARQICWQAVSLNRNGSADALLSLDSIGGPESRRKGEQALAEILRYPRRVSEQLVALRTVQTMSLIDLLNYRDHIFRLGGYGKSERRPEEQLTLFSRSLST